MYIVNKLYNCGMFQGAGKKKNYFEGWYFKHVDKEEKNIIAVIPGVSFEDRNGKSHAFIQIMDGDTNTTHYIKYDIDKFWYSKERFEIGIEDNVFSDKGIKLNIHSKEISLQGKLDYRNHIYWPSSLASPNSMGRYAFIPVMECYHGVLSLHHDIEGCLSLNGRTISFDQGIGYTEKDWGTSFPSSWIWLQSNHFNTDHVSFMLSIAKIPWHSKSFTGFIAGLWHKKKLYSFATYTGAKIDALEHCGASVSIKLSDKSYELYIKAQQGSTGSLQAPVKGAMSGSVQESIRGKVSLCLRDKKTGRLIFDIEGCCSGMELSGNIQELISLP